MRVNCIMCIVDGWQYRPAAIYLRVVPVDLGDGKEDRGDEEGECEGGYHRIGIKVDLSESGRVRNGFKEDLRKCIELVSVG